MTYTLDAIPARWLGAGAGDDDLAQFRSWVGEMLERRPDLTEDDAIRALLGGQSWRLTAQLLGLAGAR